MDWRGCWTEGHLVHAMANKFGVYVQKISANFLNEKSPPPPTPLEQKPPWADREVFHQKLTARNIQWECVRQFPSKNWVLWEAMVTAATVRENHYFRNEGLYNCPETDDFQPRYDYFPEMFKNHLNLTFHKLLCSNKLLWNTIGPFKMINNGAFLHQKLNMNFICILLFDLNVPGDFSMTKNGFLSSLVCPYKTTYNVGSNPY